jgi:ribokinase
LTGIEPSDEQGLSEACGRLLDRGAMNVVVTLGDRGVFWASWEGEVAFPAHSVTCIDATAAGDAFSGALASFLAAGHSIESAIRMANVVAALSTTRLGAQSSMPSRIEFESAWNAR